MKHFFIVLLMAWAAPVAAAQSAFLGVELDPDSELGARVVTVQSPSAASLIGVQVDDLIVGINDTRFASSASLIAGMGSFLPGELVTLHIVRGIDELALPGILGRRPTAASAAPSLSAPPSKRQPQPDSPYLQLPEGFLNWKDAMELSPNWPDGLLERGFPDNFLPGPIWSGERPDWMGEEWGMDLHFDWHPELQFDSIFKQAVPHTDADQPAGEFEIQRTVKLRYPAATPEVEREALIEAAIAEYGPEVEVRFEGEGRSISIQTTQRAGASGQAVPAPPAPPVPPKVDPDDEI